MTLAPLRLVVGAALTWLRPTLLVGLTDHRPVAYVQRSDGWPVTRALLECGHLGELHAWPPDGDLMGPHVPRRAKRHLSSPYFGGRQRCRRCAQVAPPDIARRPRATLRAVSGGET